jgi:hypothetical protein
LFVRTLKQIKYFAVESHKDEVVVRRTLLEWLRKQLQHPNNWLASTSPDESNNPHVIRVMRTVLKTIAAGELNKAVNTVRRIFILFLLNCICLQTFFLLARILLLSILGPCVHTTLQLTLSLHSQAANAGYLHLACALASAGSPESRAALRDALIGGDASVQRLWRAAAGVLDDAVIHRE